MADDLYRSAGGTFTGVSLWLSPPRCSPTFVSLSGLLSSLSKRSSTPLFEPHVTLLPGLKDMDVKEVEERVRKAVEAWREEWQPRGGVVGGGLELELMDVREGSSFFQCVLAAVSPTQPLVSLNARMRQVFPQTASQPPYFPHLSLVYGDLTSEQRRQTIVSMHDRGEVEDVDGELVEEERTESRAQVAGVKSFISRDVLVVSTQGRPEEWKVLATVPLS